MANQYFIGQGELNLRKLNDDGTPAEAFWALGDADVFTTDISVSKQNHYESESGVRRKAATWNTQTDMTFSMNVKNFNLANLAALLSGADTGAVVAGSVSSPLETITIAAGDDGVVYTEYPGISSVTVYDGDGVTPLVLDTDYEIESVGGISGFSGGIRILAGAPNFTGPNIQVAYSYVGIAGAVEALTTPFANYEVRFNAVNMNQPSTPVIVQIPVAQFNPAESISWIGTDIASFDFTGDILTPADGSAPIVVIESNAAA